MEWDSCNEERAHNSLDSLQTQTTPQIAEHRHTQINTPQRVNLLQPHFIILEKYQNSLKVNVEMKTAISYQAKVDVV